MMNETEIANRLKEYDDAFDFYMERGRMPDNIPQEDLLGGFLQQTIDENPQLLTSSLRHPKVIVK